APWELLSTCVTAAAADEEPMAMAAMANVKISARRSINTPWGNGPATATLRIDNGISASLSVPSPGIVRKWCCPAGEALAAPAAAGAYGRGSERARARLSALLRRTLHRRAKS